MLGIGKKYKCKFIVVLYSSSVTFALINFFLHYLLFHLCLYYFSYSRIKIQNKIVEIYIILAFKDFLSGRLYTTIRYRCPGEIRKNQKCITHFKVQNQRLLNYYFFLKTGYDKFYFIHREDKMIHIPRKRDKFIR
jgi:hypothetical protein